MSAATYRWNGSQAARDYDAAAPVIHPCYTLVQDQVIAAVTEAIERRGVEAPRLVDLGGGSGRLAERMLLTWPRATVLLVEPSEPFGALADARLRRFAGRYRRVVAKAQDPAWIEATRPADAVVSTSALHHLDRVEKTTAFAACRRALAPQGVFVNGDEYRPPSDVAYRELLEEWGEHMASALAVGEIPATFGEVLDRWRDRNLEGFGESRQSGDDCHETVEEQSARLYGAGFRRVRVRWNQRLWAVLEAC